MFYLLKYVLNLVDVPSDLSSYYPRDDDRGAPRGMRDTDSINASYDRYLRSVQIPSYGGGQTARPMSGGMSGRSVDDHRMGIGGVDPGATVKDRSMGLGGGRAEVPLPPDASSTLFVEGLPSDCTRREVAHIFRPFVGYKEVRLVSKESRHPGGDPLILCFVDFVSPAHAATAMDALQGEFDLTCIFPLTCRNPSLMYLYLTIVFLLWQSFVVPLVSDIHAVPLDGFTLRHHGERVYVFGLRVKLDFAGYKFDEHDRDPVKLRLQFARYPGARSGGGHRGKR
ncbi:hypothetical protein JRO89_XS15G0022600 [Xanthoceras sorbifolium]|uniref:RRM domain-containing protein n=1 Tax=Xanthoceras sorbifolium TaxID=99658 RepID=A0ABQ8H0R6_9ROSI|nr:hypothetical protein JRO89_XS15G0022600 [Xanthoceras sorbifolium]